jgi:hypothetical protein
VSSGKIIKMLAGNRGLSVNNDEVKINIAGKQQIYDQEIVSQDTAAETSLSIWTGDFYFPVSYSTE